MSDQTFDRRAEAEFRKAAAAAFAACPELRSVGVVFDFYGRLNDAAGVSHGVWLDDAGGPPRAGDAVMGSVFATLRHLGRQMEAAVDLAVALRDDVTALTAEAVRLREKDQGEAGSGVPGVAAG